MTAQAERESTIHDGYAIASLVLSLVWLFGIGSMLAVIFGNMSDTEAKRHGRKMSGFAAAGQVLGVLGIIGAVAVAVMVLLLPLYPRWAGHIGAHGHEICPETMRTAEISTAGQTVSDVGVAVRGKGWVLPDARPSAAHPGPRTVPRRAEAGSASAGWPAGTGPGQRSQGYGP
jgi:Domain of unknown function (DUF4190)